MVELPHPDQYSKPIAEHIANSGAFDVLDIEPAWIPALANGGVILPIDDYIDKRFFWAPFLQKVARCVAPNTQLTSIEGSVLDDNRGIAVSIEGVAAGREPRAAAEDLRQLLVEQLAQSYHDVKIEFKGLEDLDTIVSVGGTNMAMAHYILTVTFNPGAAAKPAAAPPTERASKR